MKTLYTQEEPVEMYNRFSYRFRFEDLKNYTLEKLPKILPCGNYEGWQLANNYYGKPAGIRKFAGNIETWIDGDFNTVNETFDADCIDADGKIYHCYRLSRALTKEESDAAKEAFASLLVKAQANLLKQREFARDIKEGVYDGE